jgi:hypothetical protein
MSPEADQPPATTTDGDRASSQTAKTVIGWREWVALPTLGIERVEAKIDTGARSSSLHAWDIRIEDEQGQPHVVFSVAPLRDQDLPLAQCRHPLHDQRWVTSSNGTREHRPVIRVPLHLDGSEWPIDLTLTSRDMMGFRMLLGREAFRGRFVVDAALTCVVRELAPPQTDVNATTWDPSKKANPAG